MKPTIDDVAHAIKISRTNFARNLSIMSRLQNHPEIVAACSAISAFDMAGAVALGTLMGYPIPEAKKMCRFVDLPLEEKFKILMVLVRVLAIDRQERLKEKRNSTFNETKIDRCAKSMESWGGSRNMCLAILGHLKEVSDDNEIDDR